MCIGSYIILLIICRLANSAEKLYSEGDLIYRIEQDEEKSYLYFMRYMNIIQILKDSKDPAVRNLINRNNFATAMKRCELLSESLAKRYELSKESAEIDKEIKKKEYAEASENEKRRNEVKIPKTPTLNGLIQKSKENGREEESYDITPNQLKVLIEQKSSRILIIDCRFASDFASSHPQHHNCISIPSEILHRG